MTSSWGSPSCERIILPGTPTTVERGGVSLTTTELAPMRVYAPMMQGPIIFGSGAHHHVIGQVRVAFFLFPALAAECHPLVEGYVVSDNRGLPDDNAHPVIDEETPSYRRPGMNLDAGDESAELGEDASDQLELMVPQEMGEPGR